MLSTNTSKDDQKMRFLICLFFGISNTAWKKSRGHKNSYMSLKFFIRKY